ncbi:hypothetical protein BGX28_000963 [Mortierella sp. GBA30]|nr:hypothetical protein BGX28_000963 [Mortierella sp. GBA30]
MHVAAPGETGYDELRAAMDRATGIIRKAPLVMSPKQITSIHTPQDQEEQEYMLSKVQLDPTALKDVERTQVLLQAQRPEYFRGNLDIQAFMNNEDDEIGLEDDLTMNDEQLLAASADEDELGEEEEEESIIPREEARACLQTMVTYVQQQDEDLGPELAVLRRLLDFTESKLILKLQQTSLGDYFLPSFW